MPSSPPPSLFRFALAVEEEALPGVADDFEAAVAATGEAALPFNDVGAGGEAAGGGELLRAAGGEDSLLRAALWY